MERRELLKALAATTVAAVTTKAVAAGHETHPHGSSQKFGNLIAASADCVQTGEVCLAHCIKLLGEGEQPMAACARSVNELLVVCTALQKLAGQGSPNTPAFARVAEKVCADCEAECRKHEHHHAECKACADACAACVTECRALAA